MRTLGRPFARRFRPQLSQACPYRQGVGRRKKLAGVPSVTPGVDSTAFHIQKVQLVWKETHQQRNRSLHAVSGAEERTSKLLDDPSAEEAAAPPTQLDQTAAVALMRRIKTARSWQQLQSIVDENLNCMNHLHVSAVVTHMAQLHSSSSGGGDSDSTSDSRRESPINGDVVGARGTPKYPWKHFGNGAGACHLGTVVAIADPRPTSRLRDQIRHPPDPGRFFDTPEPWGTIQSGALPLDHATSSVLRPSPSLHQEALAGVALQHSLLSSQNSNPYDHQRPHHQHRGLDARAMFLQRLERAVAVHLPNFEGRQLANTLWAVAKLGHKPSERWLEVLLTRASAQMHTFNAQHLANILYALMLLRYMPPPEWLSGFYAAASRRLHEFGPGELSHLCYASGKLGLQPRRQLLGGVLHHSMLHMQDYGVRELALLLYGVVHMGAQLHANWLRMYRRRMMELVIETGVLPRRLLERLAVRLSQPELAELAKAQLMHPEGEQVPEQQRAQYMHHVCMLQPEQSLHRQMDVAHHHGQRGSPDFPTQMASSSRAILVASYLPTVLCSLAQIGYRPPPVFMSTVLAAVGSCAGQLTPVGLTTVLLSLANMRYRPHPVLFRQVWSLLMESLGSLTTQQSTIAVWSCAKLGCKAPHGDLFAILMNAAARLPDHSDIEVFQLLEAVSGMGFEPTTSWLELLESDLYNRLPQMRSQDVAELLVPLTGLRHKPHRLWMVRWAETLLTKLPELGLEQLTEAVYGTARLGFRPPARLCTELLAATARGMAAVMAEAEPAAAAQLTHSAQQHEGGQQESQQQKVRRARPTWERREGNRSRGHLPETLSHLLWALAVLDVRPDARWLSGYMACLRLVCNDLSSHERKEIAWALARLHHDSLPEWPEELAPWRQRSSLADVRHDLTQGGSVASAFGIASIGVVAAEVEVSVQGAAPLPEVLVNSSGGYGSGSCTVPAVGDPSGAKAADITRASVVPGDVEASNAAYLLDMQSQPCIIVGGGDGSSVSISSSAVLDVNTFVLQGIEEWAALQLDGTMSADANKRLRRTARQLL